MLYHCYFSILRFSLQHFKFNLGDIEIKLNDIKVLLNNKAENTEKSNYVDLKNKKNILILTDLIRGLLITMVAYLD